jgi:chromosomal replication initiation ATPase DnaA
MKIKQYIEMVDTEHGLIGAGLISYKYTADNGNHRLVIYFHLINKEIIYTGIKAKNIYHRMINDTHIETLNLIKRLACDSVGIPIIRIKEKSRKREVVYARNMVFWYVNKYLKYSLAVTGQLFDKDHSTAIHGIREFNKDNKYLTEDQRLWKKVFIQKCIDKNLFTA